MSFFRLRIEGMAPINVTSQKVVANLGSIDREIV